VTLASPPDLSGPALLCPEQLMLPEGAVGGHAVVTAGGVFTAVGPAADLKAAHPQLTPVEMPGILLTPGFIDAHHHLSQSFGKALAFGEPSEIFRRIWVPLEGSLDAKGLYLAAKLAALEALRGGFTTVVDAGTRATGGLEAIATAVREAGLRCVLGSICNDAGGGGPGTNRESILKSARDHIATYEHDPLIRPSLAISIPEAATDAMLQEVSALCGEAQIVFQTHSNEHMAAVERSLVARGKRPIELLHALGALGPQTLLAHATMLTPDEIVALRDTDTAIAYNPVASWWKGNAVLQAGLMASLGVRFGLGTDGTRSDAFFMMNAAEASQRLAFGLPAGDFSCGGGWVWLDHATRASAAAIGLAGRIGAIAPGLAADYLLVDLDVPEMLPSWDIGWELVRLADRAQIVATVVAGRLRLWQGWPVDWDAKALMAEIRALAGAAVAKAPLHRVHPVSAEHRAGAMRWR
jgi:cytosine/adenosine deaminase-related metal-dependent hydrolase